MDAHCVERYVEAARQAGVEVGVFPGVELAPRLTELLRELRADLAACPAEGWARSLWETVARCLAEMGLRVTRPARAASGFSWDRQALAAAPLGITPCDAYVAETGSLFFPGGAGAGSLASLLPPVHLALSAPGRCYPDLATVLQDLPRPLPSRAHLVTGPSRTGDIEATLSTGVHGPRRVLHWIVDEGG
jgi:hypothetical protein